MPKSKLQKKPKSELQKSLKFQMTKSQENQMLRPASRSAGCQTCRRGEASPFGFSHSRDSGFFWNLKFGFFFAFGFWRLGFFCTMNFNP
ncbi:MAG: hypothetical protein LBM04_01120 [Opitutaceae bacterium]|jgi:hypothetical protein|nr:hypothetical protein [Opitutaceae bacterium]